MLIVEAILLVAGFFALVKGADWFVDGSAGLARSFRVPGLIIGLTVVAMGTSAPELAVSTAAALQGSNEIALSNVIGSNIFNLLAVLGLCAVFCPVPVDRAVLKRDFPISIAATLFVLAAAKLAAPVSGTAFVFAGPGLLNEKVSGSGMDAVAGELNLLAGAVLIGAFLIYMGYLIFDARRRPQEEEGVDALPIWKCGLLIAVGLALIVGGGQAVVQGAKEIARATGMTETLIGLTIVAVGTSLPELVTSLVATKKGEVGLAIGNALGSNIFNLMFILGISVLIRPISVNLASVYDLTILTAISALTFVFALTSERISRREGAVMVVLYLADVVFAIMR